MIEADEDVPGARNDIAPEDLDARHRLAECKGVAGAVEGHRYGVVPLDHEDILDGTGLGLMQKPGAVNKPRSGGTTGRAYNEENAVGGGGETIADLTLAAPGADWGTLGDESVVVDYDVDGVSGTAILTAVLAACKVDVRPILPHRLRDGYGFQPAQVAHARRNKTPQPPAEVLALVDKREDARARKDWPTADSLRDRIMEHGWHIKDNPDGPELQHHTDLS